ncbi:MAG: hypothetical protein ACUVX8_14225 [Candidatus Zipacnadales bacterium]
MKLLQKARNWLNELGSSAGGKRVRYRTHTEDGQQILIDPRETVIGNNEATAFFKDICGGSLREIMQRHGFTNVLEGAVSSRTVEASASQKGRSPAAMAFFRQYGIRVSGPYDVPIFAKPGTYPHVEVGGGGVSEPPQDGRPLVISSTETEQSRAAHATVVFTVLNPRRRSQQRQVTVHFHGRGIIRAKGFVRDIGHGGRPSHYDGEEVRRLIETRASHWAKKIYWCGPTERY